MLAQLDKIYIKLSPLKVYTRLVSYFLFEGRPLTTKGRFINPIVRVWFRICQFLPIIKKVKQPAFIIGIGRSGTTALGKILSIHSSIGFLNEPKLIWHSLLNYEDINGNYTTAPAEYYLDERDYSPAIGKAAHKIYASYLFFSGSKRVVDKYLELVYRLPFVKKIFPDAKFLFLVRNGYDTLQSIDDWSKRNNVLAKDGKKHDWWGVNNRKWKLLVEKVVYVNPEWIPIRDSISKFSNHRDMATVEWIANMREGLKFMKCQPQAVQLIKYENLVNQPLPTLRKIFSFLDLPNDNNVNKYASQLLSGNRERGKVNIHPCLIPLFEDTMKALDYPI